MKTQCSQKQTNKHSLKRVILRIMWDLKGEVRLSIKYLMGELTTLCRHSWVTCLKSSVTFLPEKEWISLISAYLAPRQGPTHSAPYKCKWISEWVSQEAHIASRATGPTCIIQSSAGLESCTSRHRSNPLRQWQWPSEWRLQPFTAVVEARDLSWGASWCLQFHSLFFLKFLSVSLCLASLGLCCYVQAFSSCSEPGATLYWGAWASHCGGFSCCRALAQ